MGTSFYSLLTKYRLSLFGISLLWIFFRHTYYYNHYTYGIFKGLVVIGDCGVDIFMFLSGFGLFFSYSKNKKIFEFYRKRLVRILPSVMILLLFFSIAEDLLSEGTIHSLYRLSFWFYSFYSNYWFIGCILLFYLFYPIIYNLTRRIKWFHLLLIIYSFSLVVIIFVKSINISTFEQLTVYFARLPVFVLGSIFAQNINYFEKRKKTIIILFIICLPFLYILPKDYQRLLYIFPAVFVCSFLPNLLDKAPVRMIKSLNYIGRASLEFYLIHVFLFTLGFLNYLEIKVNKTVSVVLTLLIVIVLSYTCNFIFSKIKLNRIKL